MTIAASSAGRFASGSSWYMSVNSARQAELVVDTYPEAKRRQFTVTEEQWKALRRAVEEERYFELADDYGAEDVVDASTKTLAITMGSTTKVVRYHYLIDRDASPEIARALRIRVLVRGWFDDPEAVDLRRYDQRVIDAATAQS